MSRLRLDGPVPRSNPVVPRPPARAKPAAPTPASAFSPASAVRVALRPPVVSDAVRHTRQVLERLITSKSPRGAGVVVEDAPDVNDPQDVSGRRAEEARAALATNTLAERVALMQLSESDRAAYLAVRRELLRDGGDPVAALALQTMLLEGRLARHPQLLANLQAVVSQALAPELDRQQLLADLVQEVAVPEAINQTSKGTCVPTAIGIQLAMNDPAEYVRLVSGLATPEGTVVTRGGDVLRREPGVFDDGTSRSTAQRLLAPALMELGNGDHEYDNGADQNQERVLWWTNEYQGLYPEQADRILESLYGRDFAYHSLGSQTERERAMDYVSERLAQGESVLVAVAWGDGGHQLLVTGTELVDGVEYVRYVNPWGRVERLPMSEFVERMRAVNYDPNAT